MFPRKMPAHLGRGSVPRRINMVEYRRTATDEYAPLDMDMSRFTRPSALQPPRIGARARRARAQARAQARPRAQEEAEPAVSAENSPASDSEGVYEGLADLVPDIRAMDMFLEPATAITTSSQEGEDGNENMAMTLRPSREQDDHMAVDPLHEHEGESDQEGHYVLSAEPAFPTMPLPAPRVTREQVIAQQLKLYNRRVSWANGRVYKGNTWVLLQPLRSETCYFEGDDFIAGCDIEDFPRSVDELRCLDCARLNGLLGHLGASEYRDEAKAVKLEFVMDAWIRP
ncbi:uncharacterized protein MAM_07509 [Metarhizium album ARSEF 1941]|uniref:Uncharacterized protein n=1 Tax=Metarhizium album (strain ARSEF 1941) TaxID=1081103 RepID=A0A0B2WKX9_METAS|nr:uncharacterized protein MAM_07509 [Metarhizium album ARSEF 1941]KHN94603.1 hypothetical protein MAM_07509 [Metarhizium album ARSEF 1941]